MATRILIALAVVATCACAFAQQQQQQQQYSDYDYEQAAPAPVRPQPQGRAFSRPGPPQQALRPTGPVTPKPQPVAILKQINRHNDDGSYTYGYEGADGSFKIETKLATGEVMGKYGYVDDTGKQRTIEYGANKFGFQPSGEGITVAPPTLVDETRLAKEDRSADYDDGQYYPEVQAPVRPKAQKPKAQRPKAAPQQQQYFENSYQQQRPQVYQPQPQQYEAQQYQPQQPQQQQYQPAPAPQPQFKLQAGPSRAAQSQGPEPPRLQVAGAVPVPANDGAYRAQPQPQRAHSQLRQFPAQPAPVHQYQPAPPARPQQLFQAQPLQRPQHTARAGGGGFFDQLAQDYALPQGGASHTLHDISFGTNY